MNTRLILGLILYSIFVTGGSRVFAQWTPVSELQYARISGILIINDTTVFIGGYSGAFLKSTDAGASWTRVVPSGMGTDSIFSLDNCGGYLFAGTNAPVSLYRSSDNGDSWNASGQGLPANTNVNGMTYLDSVTYAATNNGVLGSTDNGTSWAVDTAGLNLGQPPFSFPVVYGTIGITSDGSDLFTIESESGSGVYSTSTDSIAWRNIGLDSVSALAITSLDTNVFVGTDKGVFLYRGDSTWINMSSGLPYSDTASVTSIMFAKYDSLLFAYFELSSPTFYGHELYVTTDLGKSWMKVEIAGLGTVAVSVIAANHKYLFAGTQEGAWKIPITDIVTSVQDGRHNQPAGFSLAQNYPNPFNPSTSIGYRLSAVSHMTLTVYDVLGRRVRTLVNEVERTGEYNVEFNGSGLASGVYFYRMSARPVYGEASGYSKVMKMLMLK